VSNAKAKEQRHGEDMQNRVRYRLHVQGIFVIFMSASPAFPQQGENAATHATNSIGIALTTAAVSAFVGAVGWMAAYFLTGVRDDRTKRLQLTTDHASLQIREFYAPLVALTDQLDTMVDVSDAAHKGKLPEEARQLSSVMFNKFFSPLHEEINSILKTKIHLHEGADISQSYTDFFRHYASEKAYWSLADAGNDVSQMTVTAYPPEFYHDVRRGYKIVVKRYEDSVQELRHKRWGA
jgi:hypothetical protein